MIRKVALKDSIELAEIYNYYVENTIVSFEETPIPATEMSSRIESVLNANLPWLVLEQDKLIIGYAYASPWSQRSAYRFSVGVSIYLRQGSTGRGLGYELYNELFQKLRDLKIHSIMGGIALPNVGSVALHEKLGMQKVAHYKEIGFKFGKWVDVAFWQLLFGS